MDQSRSRNPIMFKLTAVFAGVESLTHFVTKLTIWDLDIGLFLTRVVHKYKEVVIDVSLWSLVPSWRTVIIRVLLQV